MPSLELIQLILSALSQSFIFSQLFSYNQEIVDGGTQNRIWSFMSTLGLLSFAFSPLSQLFPATNLSFYTYSIMAVSGLVQYVASIAHANQMAINQNEREKIQTLPYDLHNNQSLMQLALFLSRHFGTACLAIYMTSIIGCAFFGAPLYAYTSLALYSVEILNKNGYLPSFLRTPYLYANILILIVSIFGVTSWLSVGLSAGMIGFTVYDYIRCHFYGADSPTAQFPMADAGKKLTVEPIEEHDSEAEEKLNFVIQKHIRCKDQVGIHVTFNHFYQSYHIMDKILSNAPEVNYSDYAAHFNGLKTHRAPLREAIANEMCLHDKYNEKSQANLSVELGLATHADSTDTQIAYLKREMSYFVERLQHPSYRDLTHQQVATMHQYARFLLNKINQLPTEKKDKTLSPRDTLLLSIAIRTGSHCNRVYLDTLSELATEYGFLSSEALTLQEQAVMAAQSAREAAFRTYYYTVAPLLKEGNPILSTMWDDLNDYHTYESFVQAFGMNFYLRNPTLMIRFRTIFDVIQDRYYSYLFTLAPELSFSNIYTQEYLVGMAVKPGGKLHHTFIAWCEEKYPSCYKKIMYDEYSLLNAGPKINALAELMLLDLDIFSNSEPYPTNTFISQDLPSAPRRAWADVPTCADSLHASTRPSYDPLFFVQTSRKTQQNPDDLERNNGFCRKKSGLCL